MEPALLVFEITLLVGLSAICSGLNIAFMSLDIADIRRKAKIGNPDARRVLNLRSKHSHLALAAILLTNVAAVSATSLVLEHATAAIVAGVLATLLIVILGEIIPQALFVKHALVYCARLAPILHLMIFLTYPVSKPLQLLLDRLFGEEKAELETRHELGVMMTEHLGDNNSELDEDEVEIIRGALQLSEKRVRDIVVPLRNVFWLTPNTELDDRQIDEIKSHGWSRIPVLNEHHTTCYGLLLMKDLVNVDFDERVIKVGDLPLYPVQVVGSMTALDTLFRKFITGGAHLLPVEKDDRIIGIVTIEDLLEEIVGHEIEDETDRSRRFRRRLRRHKS